jgi:hypothetical protein
MEPLETEWKTICRDALPHRRFHEGSVRRFTNFDDMTRRLFKVYKYKKKHFGGLFSQIHTMTMPITFLKQHCREYKDLKTSHPSGI